MTRAVKPSTWPPSDKLYKTLAELLPVGVLLVDSAGTHTYVNDQAAQMTGYSVQELLAGTWIVHPEDRHAPALYRRALREGTQGTNYETRLVRKDGSAFWASVSWRPVRDERGELAGVCAFLADISERKSAEEALREAHAELEETCRLQREFLNNVTHEVRTPLTAVKGYAEMLMDGMAGPVSDEQAAMLKKVLTSSEHLLEIVDSVLRIARSRSGRMMVNARASDPGATVAKAISAVLPQALGKGLKINSAGDSCGCTRVYDEEKLLVIVTNLLTNAVKFTESGTIDVTLTCCDSGAEIVVADTGIGIPDRDLPTIFGEFVQLEHPPRHKRGGFGIGLAIVAAMVEAIGASLIVSSEQGLGTAFTLSVPMLET